MFHKFCVNCDHTVTITTTTSHTDVVLSGLNQDVLALRLQQICCQIRPRLP